MFELIIAGVGVLVLLAAFFEWRLRRQLNSRPDGRIRWSDRKFERAWDRHAMRWLAQMRHNDYGADPQQDYLNTTPTSDEEGL